MNLEISIPVSTIDRWRQDLQDKLEIAAVRAWETAVERTPAAGETPYSTGQLRQSLRFQKTGDLEYTIFCPVPYGAFVEFGTGPRGRFTGAVPAFPGDPQPTLHYHSGEVLVTRSRGRLLDEPYIRHTEGMVAQPFLRPALLEGLKVFIDLVNKN